MKVLTEQERNELERHVDNGWIRRQICPYAKLFIYTYSTTTELREHWDKYTRMSRGLVVDDNNRVVINCIPKFFNIGTKFAEQITMNDDGVRITEKNDGYLIQIRKDHEHGLIVTSKGSFMSDMCEKAKKLISGYENLLEEDLNYICELCCNFPGDESIIVKRWDGVEKLVLFSVRNDDGKEVMDKYVYPECFETVKEFTPDEAEKYLKREDIEGVVLRKGNLRVKCKTEHFLMMHRLISDLRKSRVLDLLREGKTLEDLCVPDEFLPMVKQWESELKDEYNKYYYNAQMYNDTFSNFTDKQFAEQVGFSVPKFYGGLVFNLRKNKDISEIIWRQIRENIKKENK